MPSWKECHRIKANTSDKWEKQTEKGKFTSYKNPMFNVFISAKNWATYAMYFHQQKTSSKFKYSDDATQESQTCRNRKHSIALFKSLLSTFSFLNAKMQIMRKTVVVKRMHIEFILFSVLFNHLNQFYIIYKTPLQALASWECDCISPSDRAPVRAAALFVFTHHCACSPRLLPVLLSPYTLTMEHFFLYCIWRAKCRVIHEIDVGKNSFTECSLDCLCLLCPLGKITSYTHFLDFTLASLSPTGQLPSVLLTSTKRNSQVR